VIGEGVFIASPTGANIVSAMVEAQSCHSGKFWLAELFADSVVILKGGNSFGDDLGLGVLGTDSDFVLLDYKEDHRRSLK
jgi:hypothetical protein